MGEHVWTPKSTKLMLQLYVERRSQFRDKSIFKRSVWQDIATEMQNDGFVGVTVDVLDRKMRNMKNTYRSIKNIRKDEEKLVRWQYYEIMDKIFSDDDTIDIGTSISSLKTAEYVPSEYLEMSQASVDCIDENSTDMNERCWTLNSTKLLLQLYLERRSQFRDPRIMKKTLWQEMAIEMRNHGFVGLTDNVLDRKIRNMKKTYRCIKDDKKDGDKQVRWQYYEIMDNIFSDSDKIDIESSISLLKTTEYVPSEYTEIPSQASVDCVDENSTDMSEHCWTPNSTKLMVELYAARVDRFRDPKILKKSLWQEIRQEMENAGYTNLTEDALDRKMRNMKRTYRTIVENKKKSTKPKSKTVWQYYATFQELFPDDTMKITSNFAIVKPEPIEEVTLCDFITESSESSSPETLDEASFGVNEHYWTPKCTKLLLQLYVERKKQFRDPRVEKKTLWHEMRKKMENAGYENLSEDALEWKIRNMKKTYRTVKKNDKKSGKRAGLPYYEIFNEILSDDKTTDIISTIGSLKNDQNEEDISFDFIDKLSESSHDCLENESTNPSVKDDDDDDDFMPKYPLISQAEASQTKEMCIQQKQLIKVEKERIKAMKRLTRKIDECNQIQIERNELLKEFLNKFA